MKPIDMISCTSIEGILTPIRFRLIDKNNKRIIIKIDRIINTKEEKRAGNPMLIFTVQITFKNEERLLELKYEIRTCKWFLYKM